MIDIHQAHCAAYTHSGVKLLLLARQLQQQIGILLVVRCHEVVVPAR